MKNAMFFLAVGSLSLVSQPILARDSYIEAVALPDRAPAGANVTLGVRVPLGRGSVDDRRTIFGLTTSYGTRFESNNPTEMVRTRPVELAQINFDSDGARDLQMANFSLTQFGRDDVSANQLNLDTGETLLVVGGVLAAVLVVGLLTLDDEDFAFTDD